MNTSNTATTRKPLIRVLILALLSACVILAANNPPSKYVRIGGLPPGWQLPLWKAGDRLQTPGKERLTLAGTVTRKGAADTTFALVHELPNRVRYSEGATGVATVFDGTQFGKTGASLQASDSDLIETLVYDSPIWFLYAPSTGLPARKLGSRFRVDPQKGKPYVGPLYDVYVIMVPVQQPGKIKSQPKVYHVNSNTQMVEMIKYQKADAPSTTVQIVLGNWTTVTNNAVPRTIQRLEDGVEVLRFNITSATFGPAVADGAFTVH